MKEDDIWLSPSYQRCTCYIGIIHYRFVIFFPFDFILGGDPLLIIILALYFHESFSLNTVPLEKIRRFSLIGKSMNRL